MGTKTNIFNKKNVLICWNAKSAGSDFSYADQLIADGFTVVTTYSEFCLKKMKFAAKSNSDKKTDKRKKKIITEQKEIAGLVVLCELTWGLGSKNRDSDSPLHAMSGIELVMNLRMKNCIIPIVFVSFLSRKQQLILSSKNDILSTPVLGHYYVQLPSDPNQWIQTLNFSGKRNAPNDQSEIKIKLSKIELEDVKSHFCDPEGMLRELNHDLRKYLDTTENDRDNRFDIVFKKIRDIIGISSDPIIDEIKSVKHVLQNDYEAKIQKISSSIEELIKGLIKESSVTSDAVEMFNVIFLDDEIGTDTRLDTLIDIMKKNGIEVHIFTDPGKALQTVKADEDNLIDLIISDHRIWNKSVIPKLMDQPQGYAFLKECAGLNRIYTYVVFSALDRNFLMNHFRINTKTLYKNGVLANELSMLNFIRNLQDWGQENKNNSIALQNSKEVFIKCYNWYKDKGRTEEIDSKVLKLSQPIINQFNLHKESFPLSCLSQSGYSCGECALYKRLGNQRNNDNFIDTLSNLKAEYKLPEDWDPSNEDHIQNLVIKFAARRLFSYFYYTLKKFNCRLADDIADNLVEYGKIRFEFDQNKEPTHDTKDKITSLMDTAKLLWIKKNNLHFTHEERVFLESFNLI